MRLAEAYAYPAKLTCSPARDGQPGALPSQCEAQRRRLHRRQVHAGRPRPEVTGLPTPGRSPGHREIVRASRQPEKHQQEEDQPGAPGPAFAKRPRCMRLRRLRPTHAVGPKKRRCTRSCNAISRHSTARSRTMPLRFGCLGSCAKSSRLPGVWPALPRLRTGSMRGLQRKTPCSVRVWRSGILPVVSRAQDGGDRAEI